MRRGSSRVKYRSSMVATSASQADRCSSSPSNRSASSGSASSSRDHSGWTSEWASGGVRSAGGLSNRRSRTAWTSVPRAAAGLGGSGSRSMTRNRYRSGQVRKSPARDGDSEGPRRAAWPGAAGVSAASDPARAAGAPGTAVTVAASSPMSGRLGDATDSCPRFRLGRAAQDGAGKELCPGKPLQGGSGHSIGRVAGNAPGGSGPREAGPGLRIARPFGIPVYISPYWFVIAGIFVVLYAHGYARSGISTNLRYVVAAAFVVLLYASVLVHELSHSVVARAFGLPMRRILLYPLGGFSEIEREPPTPGREFLVSAAGPALSLVLAGIGFGLDRLFHPVGVSGALLSQLVVANLLVGIFNMLPGLPLDGGRMLRAGVWKLTGRPASGTVAAAWAGRGLAVAVLLLPYAWAA